MFWEARVITSRKRSFFLKGDRVTNHTEKNVEHLIYAKKKGVTLDD